MNVSIMNVDEHDKIMSITSHLPHLIAFTIVGTAFSIDLKKRKTLLIFPPEDLGTLQESVHLIPKCGQIFSYKIKHIY